MPRFRALQARAKRCPAVAAVLGAQDAALGIGSEGVTQDRGEGDVGIGGIDHDGADLPLLLPHPGPGSAPVERLVDAVPRGHVAPDVGLARANVEDVRVRGRDRNRADRRDRLVVDISGFIFSGK